MNVTRVAEVTSGTPAPPTGCRFPATPATRRYARAAALRPYLTAQTRQARKAREAGGTGFPLVSPTVTDSADTARMRCDQTRSARATGSFEREYREATRIARIPGTAGKAPYRPSDGHFVLKQALRVGANMPTDEKSGLYGFCHGWRGMLGDIEQLFE